MSKITDVGAAYSPQFERVESRIEHLERELAEAIAERDKAIAFLRVYRNDTPLGNQPHMIAHDVDQFLKEGGK